MKILIKYKTTNIKDTLDNFTKNKDIIKSDVKNIMKNLSLIK